MGTYDGPPPLGGTDDLRSSPARKKAAVTALGGLEEELTADGAAADHATHEAVAELKGWDTAAGLADALTEWARQAAALGDRFATARTALSATNSLLGGTDVHTASLFPGGLPGVTGSRPADEPGPISKLSQY